MTNYEITGKASQRQQLKGLMGYLTPWDRRTLIWCIRWFLFCDHHGMPRFIKVIGKEFLKMI